MPPMSFALSRGMYHNSKKKTWQQIKNETGCYGIINTAYFNMSTYAVDSQTMVNGKWIRADKWDDWGLCIDKNGYLTVDMTSNAKFEYTIGLPTCYVDGKKYCMYQEYSRNGVSFVGTTANNSVVCLISGKDDGMTTAEACKVMMNAGCVNILRFDGSWSSQGSLGSGLDVDPSQERKAAVYLLIFEKGTEKIPNASESSTSPIENIQKELNKKYSAGLVVDGKWGPASKKALVKAVQTEINKIYNSNLVVDGIWGSASKNACPSIRNLTKNNLAWLVQAGLIVKGYVVDLDAAYGPSCASAIKQFQKNNGLGVDGICGSNTFTKLLT